jgi:hypothetical protein
MSDKETIPHRGDTAGTMKKALEGLTGILASDRPELLGAIGRVLQRVRAGERLRAIMTEWEAFCDKGRVRDDYVPTDQHQECLQELLDFLGRENPDAVRVDLLKRLFFVAAAERQSTRQSILPQEYMKICGTLSVGEILVLRANYDLYCQGLGDGPGHSASEWLAKIAEISGLAHTGLVETHEAGLIAKRLISDRTHADRSGIQWSPHYRFTDLGLAICEYIKGYEEVAS